MAHSRQTDIPRDAGYFLSAIKASVLTSLRPQAVQGDQKYLRGIEIQTPWLKIAFEITLSLKKELQGHCRRHSLKQISENSNMSTTLRYRVLNIQNKSYP